MSKILVVGAGGLGCEVIKNLVLYGCQSITIVDPDTIEIHNLSHQLLYRLEDCGHPKAKVAAERVNALGRVTTASYISSYIEDVPIRTIASFGVIVTTVDNFPSRRWINMVICIIQGLYKKSCTGTSIPLLIDCGSQELFGHVRVDAYNSCSLPNEPQFPEDCVRYILTQNWDYAGLFDNPRLDRGKLLERLLQESQEYAQTHGICQVTRGVVTEVLKRPIANISTTNSIIAAIALSIISMKDMEGNYYFYSGHGDTVLDAFLLEKQKDCMMCNSSILLVKASKSDTLEKFLMSIIAVLGGDGICVSSRKGTLYMGCDPMLRDLYSYRLTKTIGELQDIIDEVLYVTCKGLNSWCSVYIEF
ncbi:ubiquitin-activating enzyme like protein [Babesia gibsoni]|uniref:Ubiquitin-activating enzyme like protein n=1 Tax=Babesia gibsoni TaxID=33632 RepID=A0AAD8PCP3_BABGI|nr:ubiquitin-activating enzyme like protein [Babesia gibsoni]